MVSPALIRPALIILVSTAIVFIVIAVTRSGSNRPASVQSASQQLPQNIDIALKQARFNEIKDGLVDWELVAAKVEYDKSGEVAYLTGGIQMDFMKTGTRGAVKVTADSGEYRSNSKNIKMRGNVHVLTDDGVRFDTAAIDYTAAISRFKTNEVVTFHQERLSLDAKGMEMDVKSQKAKFFSSVDATVTGVSVLGNLSGKSTNSKTGFAAKPAMRIDQKGAGREKR
jgi:LPS export ABC transporter protein LptC